MTPKWNYVISCSFLLLLYQKSLVLNVETFLLILCLQKLSNLCRNDRSKMASDWSSEFLFLRSDRNFRKSCAQETSHSWLLLQLQNFTSNCAHFCNSVCSHNVGMDSWVQTAQKLICGKPYFWISCIKIDINLQVESQFDSLVHSDSENIQHRQRRSLLLPDL